MAVYSSSYLISNMGNSQDPKSVLVCQESLIVLNSELGRTLTMTNLSRFPHGFDGLRIWQSGILFARYAIQNKDFFQDKYILELGSGTGIAGLAVLKFTSCKNCLLSDYLPEVVENCRRNCRHNGMHRAIVLKMNWKDYASFKNCYDIVIGTDIVAPGGPNDAIYQCIKRFLLPGGTAFFVIPKKKGYAEELLKHVENQIFEVHHQELSGTTYLESPLPNKIQGLDCFPGLVNEKYELYIIKKKGDLKEGDMTSTQLQHPPPYGKQNEVSYMSAAEAKAQQTTGNPQTRPTSKTTIPPASEKPIVEEVKVVVIDTGLKQVDLSHNSHSTQRARLKTELVVVNHKPNQLKNQPVQVVEEQKQNIVEVHTKKQEEANIQPEVKIADKQIVSQETHETKVEVPHQPEKEDIAIQIKEQYVTPSNVIQQPHQEEAIPSKNETEHINQEAAIAKQQVLHSEDNKEAPVVQQIQIQTEKVVGNTVNETVISETKLQENIKQVSLQQPKQQQKEADQPQIEQIETQKEQLQHISTQNQQENTEKRQIDKIQQPQPSENNDKKSNENEQNHTNVQEASQHKKQEHLPEENNVNETHQARQEQN